MNIREVPILANDNFVEEKWHDDDENVAQKLARMSGMSLEMTRELCVTIRNERPTEWWRILARTRLEKTRDAS
jgi:hypothetical protein